MATITKLMRDERITLLSIPPKPGKKVVRRFWVLDEAGKWLQDELPKVKTYFEESLPAEQQVFSYLQRFVQGETFICENHVELRELRRAPNDVWELKTTDVRLFGWFFTATDFICTHCADKNEIAKIEDERGIDIYQVHMNKTVAVRNELDIAPPHSAEERDVRNEICSDY